MLQWLVFLPFFLSMLEPVKLQETDVSETLRNMNILLGSLVTKSNTQLRELQSLREDLTSDSVTGLSDSVRSHYEQFTEHKQQTEEAILNISILLESLVTKSNTQLREFESLYENISPLRNSVISLNDSLASLGDSVAGVNDSMKSLYRQLTEHQEQTVLQPLKLQDDDVKTIIQNTSTLLGSLVAKPLRELHFLTNNLTHQLKTVQQHLGGLGVHICGGTGGWRRVVYLDMTDPSATCPSGWRLTVHSKRTCGKVRTTRLSCDSVTFPVNGGQYSQVCGRIKAYQLGYTDAFEAYHDGRDGGTTIDDAYVTGVSVTHGMPRRHIWTFASGSSEAYRTSIDACPCDATITIQVPPFVGADYFCESGVSAGSTRGFHPDDPLWDGLNCVSSSTCCSFNTPPYFVKQLPISTTDDIEARLCRLDGGVFEDSPVELLELYVQ